MTRLTRHSAAHTSWRALGPDAQGTVFMLGNAALHGAMAYLVRLIGDSLPIIEIIFLRGVIVAATIVPLALWCGAWRTQRFDLHLARGAGTFVGMSCFYWSYAHLPLGEATALMFTMPLFLIVLARVFMNESVGWRRTAATVVGFLGVIAVVKPGFAEFRVGLLVPLLMGFTDAVTATVIKRLTRTDRLLTIMFYMSVVTLAISILPAYYAWVKPSGEVLVLVGAIAALTMLTQLCYVSAFRVGEMTAVAPINYVQIPLMGMIGYLAFAELPDISAGIGAAIIVASTLYIGHREARLRRAALAKPS